MKKGEIVYCIKNVKNISWGQKQITHAAGEKYQAYSNSNTYCNGEYCYIMSEPNTTSSNYLGFWMSGDKTYFNNWKKFYKHFADKKTLRLKKLKKLNEKT